MSEIHKLLIGLGAIGTLLTSCDPKAVSTITLSGLDPQAFEGEFDGKATRLFTLANASGMEVCITNFGGRIVSIMVPDREGELKDVVLGFDNVASYADRVNTPSDFGAAIGRYANRINKGILVVDGDTIQLPTNNFGHCLHGGPAGWQYQVYEGSQLNDSSVVMVIHSPDGDEHFPGNVTASVSYTLTSKNEIVILYEATTDKKTVINMTNHCYFNLSGDPTKPITDHILTLNADYFTPIDSTYMTTGEILAVEGTLMDFRTPRRVGDEIRKFEDEQVKNGNGFDHNWVLNASQYKDFVNAATLSCAETGITLSVYTNEPGIQFYSGNFLDGVKGKKGVAYNQHAGLCLETQHYPDSPNKPEWPSSYLVPGETYSSVCVYAFSTK